MMPLLALTAPGPDSLLPSPEAATRTPPLRGERQDDADFEKKGGWVGSAVLLAAVGGASWRWVMP